MTTAAVVGSGPNGLAGAIVLARAGVDVTVFEAADIVGGGTRSAELTLPGLVHDICSAVHPLALASPFFRDADLGRHGLRWTWPEIDLAHPLDGGRAAVLTRDLAATADGLGADGPAWARLFGPLAAHLDELVGDVLDPFTSVPRHPVRLARFGVNAGLPAAVTARRWRGDEARALFAGIAAHAVRPLGAPGTSAVGLLLGAAGHAQGWPVAQGGSAAIAAALVAELEAHGGRVETGRRVDALDELAGFDVVLLDVSPTAALRLAGDRLPGRVARAYRRWRYGPAIAKLDLAVDGGLPWTNEHCRRAGTVHVGGDLTEIAAAERDVSRGRMPQRPFVLVAQQYLADPGRSRGDIHPVWAYAHVPRGFDGDSTPAILAQLERFAPGTRERIVGQVATGPEALTAYNANYVGGDIAVGANTVRQLAARPRVALDPYSTGIPGVYLCSAATAPGAGVHGMCGRNAARSALRRLA